MKSFSLFSPHDGQKHTAAGIQYREEKEKKTRLDEREIRGNEWSQQQREPSDRYGNYVKRETEIQTFPPLPLCVYPSEKRANKTFIIPGKLFNVFDIKRLRGGRESQTERERDKQTGGDIMKGIPEQSFKKI